METRTRATGKPAFRFTLAELLIVAGIGVLFVAAFVNFVFFFNNELGKLQAGTDLRVEGAIAVESFKYDISYSSPSKTVFYPTEQDATGIIFPMLRRDDHSLPPLTDGVIDWTHTVAYYLFTNEEGVQEIRRTIFANRDNFLTVSGRVNQLQNVILNGHGKSAYNGSNSQTTVLASNVTALSFGAGNAIVDARDSQLRVKNVHIGSALLSPGQHSLRLVTMEEDTVAQNIGIDNLFLSPSGSPLEGECISQSKIVTSYGTHSVEPMDGLNRWSNNAHLLFNTAAPNDFIEFTFYNDMWLEAKFTQPGATMDGVRGALDPVSGEAAIKLTGQGNAWRVDYQAGLGLKTRGGYNNCHLRLAVHPHPAASTADKGEMCKITLTGNCLDKDAIVQAAFLMEQDTGASGVSNTLTAVTFNGGDTGVTIEPGATVQSDWISLPYDPAKSYLLGLSLSSLSDDRFSSPLMLDTAKTGVYRVDQKYASLDFAQKLDWSSIPSGGTLEAYNECPLISSIYVSHPATGIYVSRVYDTGVSSPAWREFWCRYTNCAGGGVSLKFRTGSDPEMSDAPAWGDVPSYTGSVYPANISSLSSKRYLQFRVEIKTASPYAETPFLKDISTTWTGPSKMVDIGGRFTHGPDFGKFMVLLDGIPISRVNVFMDFETLRLVAGRPVKQQFYVASDLHQVE